MTDATPSQGSLPESFLLVGRTKTGKSTAIADKILNTRPEAKVLWLVFDNKKVFTRRPELLEKWDVRVISDWNVFSALKDKLVSGKEGPYDIIVLDGIAALARLNQDEIAPNGMTLKEWGLMSKNVHSSIRALRDVCDVFATVLLKDTNFAEQGKRPDMTVEYDLNQDLQKRVIPEFDTVLYCHFEDENDGRKFFVMETAVFAFQYTQA